MNSSLDKKWFEHAVAELADASVTEASEWNHARTEGI